MAHMWDRGVLNKSSWHGLEEVGVMADAQAMIAAGENAGSWPVALESESVFSASGIACGDYRAIVAKYAAHPARVLGVNGDRYRATTPDEWRNLVRAASEAGAKPTGAFSLCGGSRVLATFEVGVSNGLKTQLLLADAFDGSLKLTTGFTSIRVVCANTLAISLKNDGADMAALRHTASLETKVKILEGAIGQAVKQGSKVKEQFEKASNVQLDREKAKAAFDALFPEAAPDASQAAKTKAENMRHAARVAATLQVNQVGGTRGNLATLWNAATWLVDRDERGNARPVKGDSGELNSLLFGGRAQRLGEIQEVIESVLNDGTVVQNVVSRPITIDDVL